jgi:hypothetical protein
VNPLIARTQNVKLITLLGVLIMSLGLFLASYSSKVSEIHGQSVTCIKTFQNFSSGIYSSHNLFSTALVPRCTISQSCPLLRRTLTVTVVSRWGSFSLGVVLEDWSWLQFYDILLIRMGLDGPFASSDCGT